LLPEARSDHKLKGQLAAARNEVGKEIRGGKDYRPGRGIFFNPEYFSNGFSCGTKAEACRFPQKKGRPSLDGG
jgi:hypothetical protein